MDPKALNHLDPKAREAYDRIMGTANANDPATTAAADPIPTPPTQNPLPSDAPPSIFTNPVTDPLGYGSSTNNALSSSPFPSSTAPSDAFTQTPSIPPDPVINTPPSIFDQPHTPPDPEPITDPSATLFATPDVSSPAIDTPSAAHEPLSSPASFFNNPTPPAETPAPETTSSTFPSLESDPTSTASLTPDPMAPVQPYAADPAQAAAFPEPLPSPAEVSQANAPHEASSLLRVLYIVGAVVFFAIYTIFWVKVFNLPFLF